MLRYSSVALVLGACGALVACGGDEDPAGNGGSSAAANGASAGTGATAGNGTGGSTTGSGGNTSGGSTNGGSTNGGSTNGGDAGNANGGNTNGGDAGNAGSAGGTGTAGAANCDDGTSTSGPAPFVCTNPLPPAVKPVIPASCTPIAPPSDPGADGCAVVKTASPSGAVLLTGDVLLPDQVVSAGQVLIGADGVISCVGCDCAAKDANATQVICPDAVVSPALINAHDHGGWMNGFPATTANYETTSGAAYAPPSGVAAADIRFEHRNDWRPAGNNNAPKIDEPGGSASVNQKRFGELRMLLGGATTSFISGNGGGLMRIADTGWLAPLTSHALTKYDTFPLSNTAQLSAPSCAYDKTPSAPALPGAWGPHVAEGVDKDARNEFLCLTGSGTGAKNVIDHRTSLIHGVALTAADMKVMEGRGARLIWSPRSNVSLYGETARVVSYDKLGVEIGLGTDWLPSGSMDVLRELACADNLNKNFFGSYFSDQKLWLMATRGSARALGIGDALGTLEVGKVGDVAVFAKNGKSGYRAVLDANGGTTALVLRNGKPAVGNANVVAALDGSCDAIPSAKTCDVAKRVCGVTWASISASETYALTHCGAAPANEPSCLPARPLDLDVVGGSSKYAGLSSVDDADGDGIADASDSCPNVFNPIRPVDGGKQADADGDGVGDDCDPCPLDANSKDCDGDDDGKAEAADNCRSVANADQADCDGDGRGDACDACPGVPNDGTVCPAPGGGSGPETMTIARAWQAGDGVPAKFENVCVVATKPGANGRMWIQDPKHPECSAFSGGLFVFWGSTALTGAVGDLITISGSTTTFQGAFELEKPTATVVKAAAPECAGIKPLEVTTADITNGKRYSFMLVTVKDQSVQTAGAGGTPATLASGLKLSSFIGGFDLATYPVGTQFSSLTGIVDFFNGNQLAPRSAADLVKK